MNVAIIPISYKRAWICEECEAFWDEEEAIKPDVNYKRYGVYMEQRGLKGTWEHLQVLPSEPGP